MPESTFIKSERMKNTQIMWREKKLFTLNGRFLISFYDIFEEREMKRPK